LTVESLQPRAGTIVVQVFDGFVRWQAEPVESYCFELVAGISRPQRRPIPEHELPGWVTQFQPYANAAHLPDLDTMLAHLGFRIPIAAPATGSIAGSFRSLKRRCGIYVLHFANDECYVGQTVDIVRRFAEHRRIHGDIAWVSFRPMGSRSLDAHEVQMIRLLEHGDFPLRNISLASLLAGEVGDFNDLMNPVQQRRWLDDMGYNSRGGSRTIRQPHPGFYQRYQKLLSLERAPEVLEVVRAYVRTALPVCRRTEASYWQASVLPEKNPVLVRININWQEVFFIGIDDDDLIFYMVLARRELQRHFDDDMNQFRAAYPDAEWEEGYYHAGGSDQVIVRLWDTEQVLTFLADPRVLPALRQYNLRLMKKGRCRWANSHNFDLITHALSGKAVQYEPGNLIVQQ